MKMLSVIYGLLCVMAYLSTVEGSCDVSKCSVVVYIGCPNAVACGTSNGINCAYIPNGAPKGGCAYGPCTPVIGNGGWLDVCSGIDGFEAFGPCTVQLARFRGGSNPYTKTYGPGYHGIWLTYDSGQHLGDNVLSVKMTCADTDECASSSANNCSSNALCTNTFGSYNCSCKSGYSGNGYSCTDIDECKLGTHSCHANADCTNVAGNYTCACKPGYLGNGTSCDDGNHRVVCDENFMMIYLDSRIQVSDTSLITLKDASCTANRYLPSNEYGLITTFDKCGTTKKETTTHIVYENEVTWTFSSGSGGIIRSSGKKIKFSCSFDRYQNTSLLSLNPTTSYLTGEEAGYGQFSVSLSMHTSQEFNSSITSYPAVVTLGKRVYFEAKVGSNDTDITALLEKCSASPNTNMNHPSSYVLIQQRCPVDSTTQFHNSKANHKVQFSFSAFAFNNQLNNVYIHCQLFMCHKSSTDARCSSGCQGNNLNRVRRSLSGDVYMLEAKNRQKRSASKVYAPSMTYNVNIGPIVQRKSIEDDGSAESNAQAGASFTTTHGLIIGVSVLGAVLVAVAVTTALKLRRKKQNRAAQKSEMSDGAVNPAYELS